jgi:hypothetical protein
MKRTTQIAKQTAKNSTRKSAELERIAREILSLDTLETRNSDDLDFSDMAVWTLKSALEAAYEAGKQAR